MYASRDDRLTTHFSDNFSGYTGSGSFLVKDRDEWIKITRQDFAQVQGRIRIEMLDLSLQDVSDDVVVATAFFHIHLPEVNQMLSREVARLVLIFRLEGNEWKIVHSSISIPYHPAQDGEVYPLKSLQVQNSILTALVEERTQALLASEALYRQLTEDTLDVIWKTDSNLRITYISPADERLRGFKADEMIGHHVFEMFTDEGVARIKEAIQQRAASEQSGAQVGFASFEAEHRCKDGRLIWGEVLSKPDRDAQGVIVGYHGITREITRRKLLEDQVRELAFHDSLTKLANRRLLVDRLTQTIFSSKRTQYYSSLVFLDLDNFKSLNDTHGHAAGDLLLIEVASRLKACVREIDTVARFGGDEFVLLLGNLSADKQEAILLATIIAEKIHISLSAPYYVKVASADMTCATIEHYGSASIGVAVFNGSDASSDEVIEWADSAMYQAKEDGRNLIRFHGA
ncbi:putative diguanylate cyclase YegE [mine drainage metagenome]|uniref:Putative diguanylate cyclase YegE n=1 Tax=mine drainage metagenome TaxID=410659 RepID=A0A1J5RUP4_9ZZZZ